MAIYKGNKQIKAIYRGATPITKQYRGYLLVFGSDAPTPPTPPTPEYGPMRLVCKATGDTANFKLYLSRYSSTSVENLPIVDGIIDFEVGSEYVGISLKQTPTITEVLHLPQLNYITMESLVQNTQCTNVNFDGVSTPNLITLRSAFSGLTTLTTLDLSPLDVSNLGDIGGCFYMCTNLQSLNLSTWGELDKVTTAYYKQNVFKDCNSLTHIKCKTAFRDWCWGNASVISLPAAMQEGGSGTWELTD